MSSLLRRLHVQTFVLNLRDSLAAAPHLEGYVATLVDDHTLEIEVLRRRTSMTSRAPVGARHRSAQHAQQGEPLEEIFMQLVEGARGPRRGCRGAAAAAQPGSAGAAPLQAGAPR